MKFKMKIVTVMFLVITLSYGPTVFLAQTLDELEAEIESIKEDTAKKKAEQADIESEKLDTEAEISAVNDEIDLIKSNIVDMQLQIDNKNADIEQQKAKIAEIQAQIPVAKSETGDMLQVMQKADNSNVMIQMVLTPTDDEEDNILRRIDSVNTLTEYAGGVVVDLIDLEQQLQYEKTMLDKQKAELDQSQVELETEKKNLEVKEADLKTVLQSQSDAISDIDTSVEKAAEEQAMLEDTLEYYQSIGCSGDDYVGSNCGQLAEGDGSGGGSSGGGNIGTANYFARPLSHGVITAEFGSAGYAGHTGTDMDYADYTPILATAPGVVITAASGCSPFYEGVNSCNGGYGNYVMLMHNTPDGVVFSLYGHMSSLSVSQGQTVSQGQQLGLLGDSGNSNGSHLHFEVYADSNGNGLPDDAKTDSRYYVDFPPTWTWW